MFIYVAPLLCIMLHFCHTVTIETKRGEIHFAFTSPLIKSGGSFECEVNSVASESGLAFWVLPCPQSTKCTTANMWIKAETSTAIHWYWTPCALIYVITHVRINICYVNMWEFSLEAKYCTCYEVSPPEKITVYSRLMPPLSVLSSYHQND